VHNVYAGKPDNAYQGHNYGEGYGGYGG